ncbi:MAG: hypothetical protein ACRECR_00360, partial [Thermoplasmata archaeon]
MGSSTGPTQPTVRIYRQRGRRLPEVVAFYLVLVAILLALFLHGTSEAAYAAILPLLAVVLLVYLLRYLSTRYVMDDRELGALRLFGSRRVPLD